MDREKPDLKPITGNLQFLDSLKMVGRIESTFYLAADVDAAMSASETTRRQLQEEIERLKQKGNTIACPACATGVKRVASASLDLALWQHWNWNCQTRHALEAEKAALLEVLKESNAVCVCGCPNEQHENYGEDGEACEDDTHECNRASRAVLASVAKLRAEKAALQQENETLRQHLGDALAKLAGVCDDAKYAEQEVSLLTPQGEHN